MSATILIIDDDIDLQEMLQLFLIDHGFNVLQAMNGEQGLALLERQYPDLILLDYHMPDMNGAILCQQIRTRYNHPILFLTGNHQQENKIHSLLSGGDDYITKPFDYLELLARMQSHLRWGKLLEETKQETNKLVFPGLEIDVEQLTVSVNGQSLTLFAKEMHLLLTLARNPRRVYHPRELYELIWSDAADYSPNTVKVQIHNLRKKLEADPNKPRYIKTVKGFGYKFETESSS